MSNTSSKSYAEQLEALAEQYRSDTGKKAVSLNDVAVWAFKQGLWKPYPQDVIKILQNQLSRALRSIHKTDPQGRTVRAHYAVPTNNGEQMTFVWYKQEEMDYGEYKASSQYRRGLIANDCRQLKNDDESWNENYSDGLQIQTNFDFRSDVLEASTPDTHPDVDGDYEDDVL